MMTATTEPVATEKPVRHQRADGLVDLRVHHVDGRDRAIRSFQSGCGKLRMPRVHDGFGLETVVLNTAGGLTGGDRFRQGTTIEDGAAATVSTQAYEKIYRSSGGIARIETEIGLGDGARLHWLPQPTLAYEGGAMHRTTTLRAAATAGFVAVEGLILGRAAMGETLNAATLRDDWRVWIGDELVLVDLLRLESPIDRTASAAATLAGNGALATLLVGGGDLDTSLDALRAVIDGREMTAGASRLDRLIVVRLLANDGRLLSSQLADLIGAVRREPLPKVWTL